LKTYTYTPMLSSIVHKMVDKRYFVIKIFILYELWQIKQYTGLENLRKNKFLKHCYLDFSSVCPILLFCHKFLTLNDCKLYNSACLLSLLYASVIALPVCYNMPTALCCKVLSMLWCTCFTNDLFHEWLCLLNVSFLLLFLIYNI
jgi:hypothetical protein